MSRTFPDWRFTYYTPNSKIAQQKIKSRIIAAENTKQFTGKRQGCGMKTHLKNGGDYAHSLPCTLPDSACAGRQQKEARRITAARGARHIRPASVAYPSIMRSVMSFGTKTAAPKQIISTDTLRPAQVRKVSDSYPQPVRYRLWTHPLLCSAPI